MTLSITWRARLLNGLVSAGVLVALVFLAEGRIRTVLTNSIDRALRNQARTYSRFPRPDRPPHPPGDDERPRDGDGPGGGGFPRRRREPPRLDFGTTSLLPPRPLSLTTGTTDEGNPPWSPEGLAQARVSGDDLRETRSPQGELLHVYSLRTQDTVIQTAATLTEADAALEEIHRALALLLLPLALGSAILGAILTDLALAPVRQLTRVASALDTHNLAARLPSPGGRDSFDQLVTVLNGMLSRIEAAFARQKRFTADASHELRTPLAVIKAASSLLVEQPDALTDVERRTLLRIDKTADRATRLIHDLLLLARSEQETLTIHRADTLLAPLLEEAVRDTETAHGSTPHAPVQIHCDPVQTASVDPELVYRLVSNLVSNALRHTPPEGTITLTATGAGFTLTDTGEGIPPDQLPRLGEPFYRPDESRARTHGGSGLGLALCKGIVAAHGGTLTLESKVGEGTTVIVALPGSEAPISSMPGRAGAGKSL